MFGEIIFRKYQWLSIREDLHVDKNAAKVDMQAFKNVEYDSYFVINALSDSESLYIYIWIYTSHWENKSVIHYGNGFRTVISTLQPNLYGPLVGECNPTAHIDYEPNHLRNLYIKFVKNKWRKN